MGGKAQHTNVYCVERALLVVAPGALLHLLPVMCVLLLDSSQEGVLLVACEVFLDDRERALVVSFRLHACVHHELRVHLLVGHSQSLILFTIIVG